MPTQRQNVPSRASQRGATHLTCVIAVMATLATLATGLLAAPTTAFASMLPQLTPHAQPPQHQPRTTGATDTSAATATMALPQPHTRHTQHPPHSRSAHHPIVVTAFASTLPPPPPHVQPARTPNDDATPYAKPVPRYAKWGKLAVARAKQCYPAAHVVDYRHVGRKHISREHDEETFRLWLKQGKQEWGVMVYVRFNRTTQELREAVCRRV